MGFYMQTGTSLLPEQTPIIDRTLVKYPATLDSVCINHMLVVNGRSLKLVKLEIQADIGRATFELIRANIEKLRKRVLLWWDKVDEEGKTKSSEAFHLSTFVLTFAYIMVCVVKAKDAESNNKMACFSFVAHDFRSRLDPPIPANYFGNCVGGGVVVAQARKLMEEVGLAIAAYRISDRIKKMEKGEPELDSYHPIMVTWSSKFGDYGMDFGWGRPKKVDITTVHKTKATSMVESRNGNGGVEIGMVLKKDEMDHFLLSSSPAYKASSLALAEYATLDDYEETSSIKVDGEGLNIAKLWISQGTVSALSKRGITKLFPIQGCSRTSNARV
ncbi:malonyl-CoA:anthocyanidin 5-O-glucoside-6''-O-malonyltransferase-like [Fagus crenata]